jgi:uncharacterized protein YbjT (DUF2867 family)
MTRKGIQAHARTARTTRPLTVLVTGATGNQGGAVARRLLGRGHEVRALSRFGDSPAARELERLGAEVWAGDFDDRDSLERAAAGAAAVFAMVPYEAGVEVEARQASNLFAAARAVGVGHLVYSSAAGADRRTGVPPYESKAEVERRLASFDVPHTIVAPVAFMENAFLPWTLPALQQGTLALALPESRPLQFVALADLAPLGMGRRGRPRRRRRGAASRLPEGRLAHLRRVGDGPGLERARRRGRGMSRGDGRESEAGE